MNEERIERLPGMAALQADLTSLIATAAPARTGPSCASHPPGRTVAPPDAEGEAPRPSISASFRATALRARKRPIRGATSGTRRACRARRGVRRPRTGRSPRRKRIAGPPGPVHRRVRHCVVWAVRRASSPVRVLCGAASANARRGAGAERVSSAAKPSSPRAGARLAGRAAPRHRAHGVRPARSAHGRRRVLAVDDQRPGAGPLLRNEGGRHRGGARTAIARRQRHRRGLPPGEPAPLPARLRQPGRGLRPGGERALRRASSSRACTKTRGAGNARRRTTTRKRPSAPKPTG
jgi:hypothetical protein